MRTLVIGRSPFADVIVADPSVAPHHAEIVVTDDGRLHLTDCASAAGTWRLDRGRPRDGGAEAWVPVRQAFVRADEPLRLGDHRCVAGDLVRAASEGGEAAAEGRRAAAQPDRLGEHRRRLPGRIARDPVTGEIVRRRP